MESNANETNEESAAAFKAKGNECVKKGQYQEAALYYTFAIRVESNNEVLYSNRSFVFLKQQLYDLALEDANKTIEINPNWPKGYFRRGEVLFATGSLENALNAYEKALQLLPNDPNILEAILKVNEAQSKKVESKDKLIWLCSCIGLILGIFLTILDYTLSNEPTLTNPLLQVLFIQVIAGSFWLVAYTCFSYQNLSRKIEAEEVENSSSYYILIGLVLGGSVVVIDATSYEILGIKTSAGRIFVTSIFASIGWIVAIVLRHLRNQSIELPTEEIIPDEAEMEENAVPERQSNKYTKAQARHRYKKGKML